MKFRIKERAIPNEGIYLKRMAGPLGDKIRVAKYIPKHAKSVLDVGCADGAVTLAMAEIFPKIKFLGIDLNKHFLSRATGQAKIKKLKNVKFEKIYLRDLLARSEKFDAVSFVSVLHEFFTYGEGISSVLKALADAHELLKSGGKIIVRDMILEEYAKRTEFGVENILKKISLRKNLLKLKRDFEQKFGKIKNIYRLNHFLLKYMYKGNWLREGRENYVPVTFEEYENIFKLLGMELQFKDSYLLPYLKAKWQKDFGLNNEEILPFKSTGLFVARKIF